MSESSLYAQLDHIQNRLASIEKLAFLSTKNVFTLDEAAIFLGMSKQLLYMMTSRKEIPYYKPRGKTIYFDRSDLEAWMKQNRVNSQLEVEQYAAKYNINKSKK